MSNEQPDEGQLDDLMALIDADLSSGGEELNEPSGGEEELALGGEPAE